MLRAFVGMLGVAGLLLAGCGDDGLNIPSEDTGGQDQGGDDTDAGNEDNGGDTPVSDAVDEADTNTGPSFEELFTECAGDGDCTVANNVCFQNVCVREPLVEAELWTEESNDYVRLEEAPDFSCWETPTPLDDGGPTSTTIAGNVELFGPESPTRNLCVTAYDQRLLLRWMVWLDANLCGELLDEDPRGQEPYVNCFALDPCRCEDTDYTDHRPGSEGGVEACYAEIGFCTAIEDGAMRDQCEATILERTGIEAETMIFSSGRSEPYEPNPDRTEGVFSLDNVPTDRRFVLKVSGNDRLWRDTYEYGAVIRSGLVEDGTARWDANVITDGAWRTIPTSAGIPDPTPPENTAVAGIVRDCSEDNDRQVSGAQVGFSTDPRTVAYFNGVASDTLPFPGQAYTNSDGVFASISAPAGPNRVSVLVEQDGERVNAGLRDVFAAPYSVIISTFEGNWE